MITKPCDRCERTIEVEDNRAGAKVECPNCGDMNVMPDAPVRTKPAGSTKRPEDLGLPPDAGPEQQVMLVRPALFRSRPISFSLLTVLAATGIVLAAIHLISPNTVPQWLAIVSVLTVLGGGGVIAWWWIQCLSAALEITNKRTVSRNGLFSRSTSEVVHDNIRNVQVDQTFWERIWHVGTVGISSSGQDGIEIQMKKVPKPGELQRTIDLYRSLD